MRNAIISFLVMATMTMVSSLLPSSAFAEGASTYFVDILYLKDGKMPADAKIYFDKVVPIIAGHGLKRVTPAFVITKKNVWRHRTKPGQCLVS